MVSKKIAILYSTAMKKILDLNLLVQKLKAAAIRFPVSVLFTICLTALFYYDEYNKPSLDFLQLLYSFFSFGAVISLAIVLWLEDLVSYLKQCIITVSAMLPLGIYCFFLNDDLGTIKSVELIAIGTAAALSIFFIPFLKKGKDNAFWNFSMQMLFQLCIAICFGTVILAGFSISILAIHELFSINIKGEYSVIFCCILFTPLYFLANIPDKIAKHSDEISLNKYLKEWAYILVTFAAIYAVILYVYFFQIIFKWELPEGMVSYLVSILALSALCIITLLYPTRFLWLRYLGLLMLPLLVLMTIGIVRRIDDYGLTIHRCYVLLLNIWFYGIFIYIFITKAQSIKWIPITFAAIGLIASISFWGIPNITKNAVTAEVNRILEGKKISFGDRMEEKNVGKIKYLEKTFGKESVLPFFYDEADMKIFFNNANFDGRRAFGYGSRANYAWMNEILNTRDFNTFIPIHYDAYNSNEKIECFTKGRQLIINIVPDDRAFSISLPTEKKFGEHFDKFMKAAKATFQEDDYIVLIEQLSGLYYETSNDIEIKQFKGYLFYRK